MREDSYKCDCCPTRKGQNNHWFLFRAYPDRGDGAKFTVGAWNPQEANELDMKHLCSEACVVKTVSEWLGMQKERGKINEIYDDIAVSGVSVSEDSEIPFERTS